jgi:hypothetical protein
MKSLASLMIIGFLAVGCSSSSQTQPESALDHVESQDAEESSGESEEYRHDVGLYERDTSHDSQASVDSDEAIDDTLDVEGDEIVDVETEAAIQEAFDDLIGSSWSEEDNERVYGAVKELGGFEDYSVIPLAHFRRGARSVVIAWPALTPTGDLGGTAVYGVCVEERGDGSYHSCGQRWLVNEINASTHALESTLGGSDYEVVSNQASASLDSIGDRLTTLGNSFVTAASEGDGEDMFGTAQEFLQMLPVEDVAFDNSVVQMLVNAARAEKEFLHIKTETGDLLATITMEVRFNRTATNVMSLTAQRDSLGSSDWTVVDSW